MGIIQHIQRGDIVGFETANGLLVGRFSHVEQRGLEVIGRVQVEDDLWEAPFEDLELAPAPFVVTMNMLGCLSESDPVVCLTLEDAVRYICDEVDRMTDEADEASRSDEGDEWESALAHAQSYRDGAGDVPYVPLPDGYVISAAPLEVQPLH